VLSENQRSKHSFSWTYFEMDEKGSFVKINHYIKEKRFFMMVITKKTRVF
jgi:predicted transcriptional regulator